MTKPMQQSLMLHNLSIPKPFVVQGFVLPVIQACQVGGPGSATAASTPSSPSASSPVYNGAIMTCSFGAAPATLAVIPPGREATKSDAKPGVNIQPFGMCMSPANPQVAAATAAALGVLTPQPCIPVTHCWDNPSGGADLQLSSTLRCMWLGTISVVTAGKSL